MSGPSLAGKFPVKRFLFSQATATTHQVIAAVAGKRLVIVRYVLKVATGQTLTWVRGTSTAISGAMAFATSDLLLFDGDDDVGVLESAPGERLALTLGAATQVSGYGSYIEMP